MKTLLTIAMLSLSLVSCSNLKDKFNDVKLDVAKEGKDFVTKELKSSFVDVHVDGANCESEAEAIGLKVEEKLISFLKAEQKSAAMVDKSLSATILPVVCNFVVSNIVPEIVDGIETKYVCLKEVGADKMIGIGKDLCDLIK